MAETTGVSSGTSGATSPRRPRQGRAQGGNWFKKNKGLALALAAGGTFLVVSHKGSTASGGGAPSPAPDPGVNPSDVAYAPGGGAPVDTGGGSYTTQGPSSTTSPTIQGPLVDVSQPTPVEAGGGPLRVPPGTPDPVGIHEGHRPPGKRPGSPGRGVKGGKGPSRGRNHHNGPATGRGGPKPKEAPHGKPNPHNSKPVGASHPNTPAQAHAHPTPTQAAHKPSPGKTSGGKKRRSPVEVESMDVPGGAGSGITIHGRDFPGAIGYRMGMIFQDPSGPYQEVIVNYGGHTDTCLSYSNGRHWVDHVPGRTPPSRGVPMAVRAGEVN
jgi:hypothetical protein